MTVMNTSQGPTLPAEGRRVAVPSWALMSWVCDDPRRTGNPAAASASVFRGSPFICSSLAAGIWASVVAKVTGAPRTGLAAGEPSVTRMMRGWKTWPGITNCEEPLTVSSVHAEAEVENKVKIWHGELLGATQALTCTVAF